MSTVLGTTTTDRIRRHLVGLKMPLALEALQTTLSRIEQGEVTALDAIEALLPDLQVRAVAAAQTWTPALTPPRSSGDPESLAQVMTRPIAPSGVAGSR